MRVKANVLIASLGIVMAAGCSRPGATLQSAADYLGVAATTSIAYSGTGLWRWFGQQPVPGGPGLAFEIKELNTTISYKASTARVDFIRVQVVDPARARPAREHRQSQFVAGAHAWTVFSGPTPGPFAQPTAVDERIAEIWATPQGFIKAALSNNATSNPVSGGGSEISFSLGKHEFIGLINARNEVERVQTWFYTPVSGDTPVEFVYSNYEDFGGIRFPGRIVQTQGGQPVLELDVTKVTRNPEIAISAPESVTQYTAPATSFETPELAQGVYFLLASTGHNSLVIDQADHIVVFEAPVNEAHSEAVIAKAKELIPGKPIRYVINSHSHFDHSGGLRTYVDEGVTIVTHELNRPFYEELWAAPHTLSPDRLSRSGKAASFQTVGDKHVLTDGKRNIEVHLVAGSGHADGFLMVFLPAEKVLIGGTDGYTTSTPGTTPSPEINPYAVNYHENIQRLKLDVSTIAPLHGKVGTMADLRRDIGLPEVPTKK